MSGEIDRGGVNEALESLRRDVDRLDGEIRDQQEVLEAQKAIIDRGKGMLWLITALGAIATFAITIWTVLKSAGHP